MVFEEVTQDCI